MTDEHTASHRCPCCGGPLPIEETLQWDAVLRVARNRGVIVKFKPAEAKIFDALFRNRNRYAFDSYYDLAEAAYANDPNGGPDSTAVIGVHICRMRRHVRPLGYEITLNQGRPKVGFKLVPIVTNNAGGIAA